MWNQYESLQRIILINYFFIIINNLGFRLLAVAQLVERPIVVEWYYYLLYLLNQMRIIFGWSLVQIQVARYDIMAEWLRRWTANPLGSARAGSNPADVEFFLVEIV